MKRMPLLSLALVIPGLAFAASPEEPVRRPERRVERHVRVIHGPGGAADHTMSMSWLGSAVDGNPMTGAPFSATAVTEMDQPLADGNHIRQKTTATLARDSAGRTRREVALGAIGPLVAGANPERLVHIADPSTDTNITLDPARRLAFKMQKGKRVTIALPKPPPGSPAEGVRIEKDVRIEKHVRIEKDVDQVIGIAHGPGDFFDLPVPPGGPGSGMAIKVIDGLPPDAPKPVREELGTQVIEGVKAEGERTTVTIPAGKIGNDRPLVTISERWHSPELGLVVMSRHTDPRFGTTTYRLTNIDRREPSASHFEVPSDYKMEEGPVIIRKRIAGPAK
jgi:hypothetical protein